MIPPFILLSGAPWPILPPGVHDTTIAEVHAKYAINPHRQKLFQGLLIGLGNIFSCGCQQIFLNGSFITAKPMPQDYEVAWDPANVDPTGLDPLFLNLMHGTDLQKQKYGGEYFPSSWVEARSGKRFVDFFQTEKFTGQPKGILRIQNYLKGGGTL